MITSTYDALNRETGRTYSNTASKGVNTTYDLLGRKLTQTYADASQSVAWTWDNAGRKLTETTNGKTVTLAYDADGNRASLAWPDGQQIAYAFDGLDRLASVGTPGGAVSVSPGYDGLGRATSLTRASNVTTAVTYDSADRMTGLAQTFVGNVNNVSWALGYTPAGQIATSTASTTQFDYQAPAAPTYNAAADGLNRNAAVAATGAGGCGPSSGYDCNGNRLVDLTGTKHYAYDGDNRLTGVTGPGLTETLGYDPTGRLATTTANGTATSFLYDGDALVAEYDGSGNLLRRYVHGSSVDNPFVWFEGATLSAATARYLVADRQGSIVGYADSTGTTPAGAVYAYDPYGLPSNWGGSRFRYTGQIALPEAQLYYYKARVYDPAAGTFLQMDPIGYKDNLDLYEYVGDDPLNHTDPTGNWPDWGDIAGALETLNDVLMANPEIGGPVEAIPVRMLARGAEALEAGVAAAKEARVARLGESAAAGARREETVAAQLRTENPSASVQGQQTLRDAAGKKVVDPVTQTGRRVDHAVIENGTAKTVETTSPNASKAAQAAKEQRVRDAGGTYVRDRRTRELVRVPDPSAIRRVP